MEKPYDDNNSHGLGLRIIDFHRRAGCLKLGLGGGCEGDAVGAEGLHLCAGQRPGRSGRPIYQVAQASVANPQDYEDDHEKVAKESNTLIIIVLALGLHDQESKYKARAGDLMKAAQAVAATKDYSSAKKAVDALQDVAAGKGDANGAELKWVKVASLPELMKQVPLINNKLKRAIKPEKFTRRPRTRPATRP